MHASVRRACIAAMLMLAISACGISNPYDAPLPADYQGTREYRLTPEERELLMMYYEYTDPDAEKPKTIGEALRQERERMKQESVANGMKDSDRVYQDVRGERERQDQMEAMREVLKVWLVQRELTTRNALDRKRWLAAGVDPDRMPAMGDQDADMLVTTFQFENRGERTINRIAGIAKVLDASGRWRFQCSLDDGGSPLPPQATRNVQCVVDLSERNASGGEKEFAAMPADGLQVRWEGEVQEYARP